MPIHFGTDGWRAVISDTFTFDNLRLVSRQLRMQLLLRVGPMEFDWKKTGS